MQTTSYFTGLAARLTTPENPVLAGNLLLLQLHTLMTTGIDGFSNAAETLVGAAIGARDLQKLRSVVRRSNLWGLAMAVLFSLLFFFFGRDFLEAMTDRDSQSAALEAERYLPFVVAGPVLS